MRAALASTLLAGVLLGCEPPCTTDAECAAPAVCGSTGRCLVPTPGPDGAACSDDRHCAGGACVVEAGAGRCATSCDSAAACGAGRCGLAEDTPASGARLRFVCGASQGDRFYGEACTADAQCRPGLCHAGHCSAPCGACPTDFQCQPATLVRGGRSLDHGACTWWPVQPVVELGPADTSASGATALAFELPEGAGAFTLVLEDAEDLVPAVTRLTGPDGTVFVGSPRGADGGQTDLARGSSGPGTATVLVPGSDLPRAKPKPGRYALEVVTYEVSGFPVAPRQVAGRLERVAAVLKRPARGGVVDVTMQLAPELGYSVADGGGTWINGVLDGFESATRGKLGVSLGQVRMSLLPPDAGVVISTNAQSRALQAAHGQGAPAARAINVLVVDQLTFAGGVAGGTPGAPGVYGRPGSGITLSPLASGPQPTGLLMAHEVLHWLGLWHTSDDFFGADLISDTPSCADPSGSGCPDLRNLMFPYFPAREPLTLTPGQVQVLEGSPWVYRWLHPGACGAHEVVGLERARGFAAGTTAGAPAVLSGSCGGSGGEQVHLLRLEAPAARLEATARGAGGFAPVVSLRRAECGGEEVACARVDGGVASVGVGDAGAGAWFVVVDSAGDGGAFTLDVTVTP